MRLSNIRRKKEKETKMGSAPLLIFLILYKRVELVF
jgi:hypothetical protein